MTGRRESGQQLEASEASETLEASEASEASGVDL